MSKDISQDRLKDCNAVRSQVIAVLRLEDRILRDDTLGAVKRHLVHTFPQIGQHLIDYFLTPSPATDTSGLYSNLSQLATVSALYQLQNKDRITATEPIADYQRKYVLLATLIIGYADRVTYNDPDYALGVALGTITPHLGVVPLVQELHAVYGGDMSYDQYLAMFVSELSHWRRDTPDFLWRELVNIIHMCYTPMSYEDRVRVPGGWYAGRLIHEAIHMAIMTPTFYDTIIYKDWVAINMQSGRNDYIDFVAFCADTAQRYMAYMTRWPVARTHLNNPYYRESLHRLGLVTLLARQVAVDQNTLD